MTLVTKSTFEELHIKYENLKAVCKECFLRSAEEQNSDYQRSNGAEAASEVDKIEMPELDENFDVVLKTLSDIINGIDANDKHYIRLVAMKASIYYEQAKTLVTNNKEIVAKELLDKAISLLKDYSNHPEVCFLHLRVANHYAYLSSKSSEFDKARDLLEEAENIYKDVKNTDGVKIFNSDDLFIPEELPNLREDTALKLEKLVTNNLQMLGWVYSKQKLHDKFATYHHMVLRRQLEMRDGNALIWALKTARLASYFLSISNFRQARHHLAASSAVLEEYEIDLKKYQMTDSILLKWKELQHYYADVAKCWTKYGLYLFSVSKSKMVQSLYGDTNHCLEDLWISPFSYLTEKRKLKDDKVSNERKTAAERNDTTESANDSPVDTSEPIDKDKKLIPPDEENVSKSGGATGDREDGENSDSFLEFPSLNLKDLEDQVTCKLIQTTEEARSLFMFTHTWLKRSKIFYTIKDHPLEYINGILDLSELYRYLAFYEEDIESQYSVQKRRADSLETLSAVLREIRPQCYLAVSIELLRELAEVQMEMMGLNLRRLCMAQDGGDSNRESTLHKMEAVSDIHARLEHFGELAAPGTMGQDDYEEEDGEEASDSDGEAEGDDEDSGSEQEEVIIHENRVSEHEDISSETESVGAS